MALIKALAVTEPVRVDVRRVSDIVSELGAAAAQEVIGLALEQMAGVLSDVDAAVQDGNLAQTVVHADGLSRLAWQVGLVSLAGVAMDLGSCAERRDLPGVAAVKARLMRVGNRSLTAIWDGDAAG